MTWTPCIECGEPSPTTRCKEHNADSAKANPEARGYDSHWRRLSKQARRLQPWCSDCGRTDDLTADHLRWPAHTVRDVEVVCRSCNSKRGPSRGARARQRVGSGGSTTPEITLWRGNLSDSLRGVVL